ncbi:hypothetical protein HYX02_07965 [Candidatus Woesearchaeota archaeon]|nr:hypothetical protein [Candidatus Woesearchaeota archaeon]
MKNIYILFLALGLLVFSACAQNNQQEKKSQSEIKTLIIEKDKEISQLQNQTEKLQEETFLLSKNEENVINAGDMLALNLTRERDQVIVSIEGVYYKIFKYTDVAVSQDKYYIKFKAPEVPGNYQVLLVEYPGNTVAHTYFNLTVLGETKTKEEATQIAKVDLSSKFKVIRNVSISEVILSDNKWNIQLLADYSFGCCSVCGSGEMCIAMCVPCGLKKISGHYIISKEGIIEMADIKEVSCEGGNVWFRDITSNKLCSIDWDNLN